MQRPETSVDGPCFRFAHLNMVLNEMFGPCPFSLVASNVAYSLPQAESLIDNDIAQLLRDIDPVAPAIAPPGSSLFIDTTSHLIPSIMAADPLHEPCVRSDARAILWNILSRYGHAAFRRPQSESFMRIAYP
jgi:hypothetical protein